MYNHRNGKWCNTETTSMEGDKHITVATRDIHPGEQIYITYNFCRGCIGRRRGYGTGGEWSLGITSCDAKRSIFFYPNVDLHLL